MSGHVNKVAVEQLAALRMRRYYKYTKPQIKYSKVPPLFIPSAAAFPPPILFLSPLPPDTAHLCGIQPNQRYSLLALTVLTCSE